MYCIQFIYYLTRTLKQYKLKYAKLLTRPQFTLYIHVTSGIRIPCPWERTIWGGRPDLLTRVLLSNDSIFLSTEDGGFIFWSGFLFVIKMLKNYNPPASWKKKWKKITIQGRISNSKLWYLSQHLVATEQNVNK